MCVCVLMCVFLCHRTMHVENRRHLDDLVLTHGSQGLKLGHEAWRPLFTKPPGQCHLAVQGRASQDESEECQLSLPSWLPSSCHPLDLDFEITSICCYSWPFTWVLGIELWSSCLCGKHFLNELSPSPCHVLVVVVETGYDRIHYANRNDLELLIFLPPCTEC